MTSFFWKMEDNLKKMLKNPIKSTEVADTGQFSITWPFVVVCRKGHAEGTHGKTWSWQDGSDLINTITGGDIEDRGGEAVWPPQQDQVVRGSAGDQQTYKEIRVQITDTSLCTQLYHQVAEPALHSSQ